MRIFVTVISTFKCFTLPLQKTRKPWAFPRERIGQRSCSTKDLYRYNGFGVAIYKLTGVLAMSFGLQLFLSKVPRVYLEHFLYETSDTSADVQPMQFVEYFVSFEAKPNCKDRPFLKAAAKHVCYLAWFSVHMAWLRSVEGGFWYRGYSFSCQLAAFLVEGPSGVSGAFSL
ncbi:predicted protein [Lichtheimia corymbifera JMRC:FSU:9682]|uniref:Uncharacterized protein n=1 Tax=Lichtheimia corymbifera JMRC:FSU:9682 TaxID=1263082 RepID=A0A068RHT8_9FUNG|nr:predicted protein [Lichtheimia corymbifera JMRC:FSU:9682]